MAELRSAYLMAAGAALCWGLVVIFIKQSGVSGRLGIGISLLTGSTLMCAIAGRDLASLAQLDPAVLRLLFIAGTVQFAGTVTVYYSAVRLGRLSVVVPITRLQILPLLALSIWAGLEQFSWGLLGVALIVVAGSVLVGRADERDTPEGKRDHTRAVALAITACIMGAVGLTLIGMLPKDLQPVTATAGLLVSGLISYSIYALASGLWRRFRTIPLRGALCYVGHGAVSFGLGYVLYVSAVQIAGPPRTAVIITTYPLVSAIVGWIVYKERFMPLTAVGAVLIIGGVMLLQVI